MSRSRNLKPGFFKNEELAEIEPLGRILYEGLWCLADREGRLEDRPKKIKIEILPYDGCNIEKLLSDLIIHGFIIRYEVDGNRYIWIPKFKDHQNPHPREPKSTIPAFDEKAVKLNGEAMKINCNQDTSSENSGTGPAGSSIPSIPSITSCINNYVPTEVRTTKKGRINITKLKEEHWKIAEYLRKWILRNNPNGKTPDDLTEWANEARLMMENDKRPLAEIKSIIDWCQADPFWMSNILSVPKLRKQYDTLKLQMNNRKVVPFNGKPNQLPSSASGGTNQSDSEQYDKAVGNQNSSD